MNIYFYFILSFFLFIPGLVSSKEVNFEELRWNLPQDLWLKKDMYLMKGTYFRINLEKSPEGVRQAFNIYGDPQFIRPPIFSVFTDRIEENGKVICSFVIPKKFETSNEVIECGYKSCKVSSDAQFNVNQFNDLNLTLSKEGSDCSFPIKYVVSSHLRGHPNDLRLNQQGESPDSQFNFEFNSLSKDKKSLEISIRDKTYYLDIRACNKISGFCEVVNYSNSLYEKDLSKLKEHQRKKDLPIMNILIEDLLPCVKKKDLRCIEKYFVTENDDEFLELGDVFQYPKKIIVTDEMIKELDACLDYNSVLPHLLGSKGINKVCIFQEPADSIIGTESRKGLVGVKLMGIAYPEAVRTRPLNYKIHIKP